MGKSSRRWMLWAPLLVFVAGCASLPIDKIYRDQVTENVPPSAVRQAADKYAGMTVIWGGRILNVGNLSGESELVVMGMRLDTDEQPRYNLAAEGRFIAKSENFLDPEIYRIGTDVTLAGKITGSEERLVNKAKYVYPVIAIEQLVLWRAPGYYYDDGYGPYYGWPYWGWSWYWFGFPFFRHFEPGFGVRLHGR
jgi:outer membrane lipoprotein